MEKKTAAEVLSNVIHRDEEKLLLHHSKKLMSHNGINYFMVHKDLALEAMEEYASLTTPASPTMEWVKASEELPEIMQPLFVKFWTQPDKSSKTFKVSAYYDGEDWYLLSGEKLLSYVTIEWLRESSPPAPVQEGEEQQK